MFSESGGGFHLAASVTYGSSTSGHSGIGSGGGGSMVSLTATGSNNGLLAFSAAAVPVTGMSHGTTVPMAWGPPPLTGSSPAHIARQATAQLLMHLREMNSSTRASMGGLRNGI